VLNLIRRREKGMLMIEVLITMLVVSLGLLGIAAMYIRSQQFADEAYQRYQALDIAHQLAEQLSTNRTEAAKEANSAYVTNPITGTSLPGGSAFSPTSTCTGCDSVAMAGLDMTAFNNAITGAQKVKGASQKISALVGALGCVESLGVASSVTDPLRYRISVVWQGRQVSAAPIETTGCGGNALYGVGLRRVVSLEVQVL